MRKLQMLVGAFMLAALALGTAGAQGVQLTVSSPAEGASITGTNVTVEFQASGIQFVETNVPVSEAGQRPEANNPGEGHAHFMLDLQPLVVWTKQEPYTFTNVAPGAHQLMVEVTQNDHSPLSPPVRTQIAFTTQLELPATGAASTGNSALIAALLLLAAALMVGGYLLLQRQQPRHNTRR